MTALALWSLWFKSPKPSKGADHYYAARAWLNDYRDGQSRRERKQHVVIGIDLFRHRIYEKRLGESA